MGLFVLNEMFEQGQFEAARNQYMVQKWQRNIEAVRSVNEGAYGEREAIALATLLENTDREMKHALNEITEPTAIGPFKRYAFNLIERL